MIIDTNDVQVFGAGSTGIGAWYLPLSQVLQISISFATLIFICCKIYQLIKNNKNA
tara:strand:+ start:235 stop:402 length:168 start_codon:yes stop_codon:yes gene_type:complete